MQPLLRQTLQFLGSWAWACVPLRGFSADWTDAVPTLPPHTCCRSGNIYAYSRPYDANLPRTTAAAHLPSMDTHGPRPISVADSTAPTVPPFSATRTHTIFWQLDGAAACRGDGRSACRTRPSTNPWPVVTTPTDQTRPPNRAGPAHLFTGEPTTTPPNVTPRPPASAPF